MTQAEENLFDTELPSIELCEQHLSAIASSPSSPTKDSVLPDWFDRPGAPEAIEVGADLRNRFDQLSVELGARKDEGSQLLQKVLAYEETYVKFNDWLTEEREVFKGFLPPSITIEEIKKQLKQVEVL